MQNLLNLDPVAVALLIVSCFVVSGIVHVLWLKLPISLVLNIPLDGGLRFRGERIFGDNKTVRGLVIIIPLTGLNFFVMAELIPYLPDWFVNGIWSISSTEYAIAGLLAAMGFMLGELPNSFIKRQCGVAPGKQPQGRIMRLVTTVFDRLDSLLGMMIVLSFYVPVPAQTWMLMILIGPVIHSFFSYCLYWLKVKGRPG